MTSGWIEVFNGGLAEALIVQSKLEAFDIPTQLPGNSVKRMDPFITGAGPLSQSVEVPLEAAEEALALLAARPDGDSFQDELTPEERELQRLSSLGRNLRWAAVFAFMVPFIPALFALWIGARYFSGVRALGVAPKGHAWNLGSIALAVGIASYYAWMLSKG